MGMDLSPRNRECASLHLNWTGWNIFCNLVDALGCDTSSLSGSNDGDYIPAAVCRAFAKSIRSAIATNRICKRLTPDGGYSGGYREYFIVTDVDGGLIEDREDGNGCKLVRLDPEGDTKWLYNICDFFESCSGCRQY